MMWDQRYSGEAYAYGTEPNEFLVAWLPGCRWEGSCALGKAKAATPSGWPVRVMT